MKPARPGLAFLVVPGLGLLFALIFAAQNYSQSTFVGRPAVWRDLLAASLPRWLLYSLLAPGVAWCVNRFPIAAGRVPRRLLLHAAAGVLFALVHSTLMALYFRIFHLYPAGETMAGAARRLALVFSGINVLVYFGLAGVYHALRYFREVRHREVLAAELRASLTAARLAALRAQLNPHFLFNTLNATSTLALTGEREQVVQIIGHLSDLLRVSLDRNLPQEIPLERELGILSAYLEIQRIRFGSRLAVELDVPAEVRVALVPVMLLQPLVENAFEHGVARRPGPGRVRVHARRAADRLVVEVEDTGPGFAGEAAAEVREGIGLGNTRARLEQLYGDAQRLDVGNRPEGGARVSVSLPWHLAEEAA